MNPIAEHIIATTGDVAPHEPQAIAGDWAVGIFAAGVALGWLLGWLAC